jgi:peptidyl-tRNA hydrolase
MKKQLTQVEKNELMIEKWRDEGLKKVTLQVPAVLVEAFKGFAKETRDILREGKSK